MQDDKLYSLALSLVSGVGPVNYKNLVATFGSAKEVLAAPASELAHVPGIGNKLAGKIKGATDFKAAQDILAQGSREGIWVVSLEEDAYPLNLRNIADPPPFLYVKGELKKEDERAVAMVGTRRCSNYGRVVGEKISQELAAAGLTIVSGMARGIDSICHRGALARGGRTVAVLGCGLDVTYPWENKDLYEQIPRQGALVSEFPFGEPPRAQNFPRRNRIISGLALGVVIVEAPARSGALITAALALDQGREVFAVPGSPGMATSQGCNRLIKMGAKLTESAEDIFQELLPQMERPRPLAEEGLVGPERRAGAALTPEEERIMRALSATPLHVDEMAQATGLPSSRLLGLLTGLELAGRIKQLPGMMFVKGY